MVIFEHLYAPIACATEFYPPRRLHAALRGQVEGRPAHFIAGFAARSIRKKGKELTVSLHRAPSECLRCQYSQGGGALVDGVFHIDMIEHVVNVLDNVPQAISGRVPFGILVAQAKLAGDFVNARMVEGALKKHSLRKGKNKRFRARLEDS